MGGYQATMRGSSSGLEACLRRPVQGFRLRLQDLDRSRTSIGSVAIFHLSRWAYNEPRSHSGYNLVRYYLFCAGVGDGYFGRVVESGSHRRSLQMILDDQVDGSAIDSTVLDWEMRHHPEIRSEIRIIKTLGPSPAPPWVVSRSFSVDVRAELQNILLSMHKTERGRGVLAIGHIDRFVTAKNEDYEVIRAMARAGQRISL